VVTVVDCERVQANWFRVRAARSWIDGTNLWTDGPDGLNLMFPAAVDPAALRRAVDLAVAHRRTPVGAWLGLDTDPAPLVDAGFERGWAPWWMTADLADVGAADDPRIVLSGVAPGFFAQAYNEGRAVGQAWSFVDGDLAGVFDMGVRPPFRRHGLGTGLLRAVCAAARTAGARAAVLNATPEGEMLYSTCGFTRVGEGITYWLHLKDQL
jgi:GNAT superfamily N-acetyltransferase